MSKKKFSPYAEGSKTIDFEKAKEIKIPDFGLAGKLGKLKGDGDYTVLITQDFKNGLVGALRFGPGGKLDALPQIPKACVVIDSSIDSPFDR